MKSKVLRVELSADQWAALRVLGIRLELPPQDLAPRLINAATQALESEEHILWPIYLIQAGSPPAADAPDLS